jgi:hypothetical protein
MGSYLVFRHGLASGSPLSVKTFKDWSILVLGMTLAAMTTFEVVTRVYRPSSIPAAVDGAKLGRAYAPQVVSTLSDAWNAAADALGQGKSVAEAQAALQQSWQAARAKAFAASVAPDFSKVLAEGVEPKDDAQRAQVVALWRSFARGLKGGR